jgi:glycosyltransferase involved in cell wall biosynthesis
MTLLHLMGSAGAGGAETYFVSLAEALARDGLSQAAVIRAHPMRERRLRELGLRVELAPYSQPFDFVTPARIAKVAEEVGAKVLLQWMNRAGKCAPKHGPWTRIGRLGGYYDLKYYRGCALLVANTEDIRRYVTDQGWPADRAVYIPNFATAGPQPAEARARHDTPETAPLLIAMGRLHAAKGHDVTLSALTHLPECYLWIAGDGPLADRLQSLAHELGVADRVRFLGWRDDPSALYRAADICVFPSRYEPLGNTVIQAWAHGTPIVAAESVGPAALIHDGEDGVLVRVDDPEALAAGVQRLLDDPALADRLRAAGLARAAQDFAEGPIVARWRELFAGFGEV